MKLYEIIPCEGNHYNEGHFIVGCAKELKKIYSDLVVDYYNNESVYRPVYSSLKAEFQGAFEEDCDYTLITCKKPGEMYNTLRIASTSAFMLYLCNDWVRIIKY